MADSNLLVLAKEFSKLRSEVKNVLALPVGPEGKQGEKGTPGKDGKDGLNGRDGIGMQGPAGAPGRDGRDGQDGKDGVDGQDGVSVTNAYVDFDGSLVIELSNGNQIDAGFVSADNRDSVIQQIKSGALSLNELLPSQEDNVGKVLATDGENTYWATVSGGGVGGAVDSVNGQTGTVVLTASDVGAVAEGTLATVATTGSYTDLIDQPTIPAAQVNSDWNSTTGVSQILNKPSLATVATTGAYSDLTGKPTLGTAAAASTADFATAAQGDLADTAIQPDTAASLSSLNISGNLNVNGSFTTTNTETLQVQDPIIYVASGATSINTLDQGLVGHFNNGTYQHTGIVRDHTDGKWKLFEGVTTEPTTTVNWSQATYSTLKLGTLETTSSQVSNWDTAYGWGNHASAGYLTTSDAASTYQPIGSYLTSSAIGSTVQAYDADLTSWAAIAPSTKQDTLVSATNIKTINGNSILGSGDLTISGGSGSPSGATGSVQYNNAGAFAGAANVDIDNGDLTLATNNSPVAPAAGNVKLFNKSQGGRQMPAFIGPNGLDSVLQPHLGKNGWALWKPLGNSTTVTNIGTGALSVTGTATSAAYATTNLHTRSTRVDFLVTTAATTAVAGYRVTTNVYRVTDGFHHVFRVAPATGGTVATRRFFCGMSTSTAAPTDVDPSTLTNSVGAGYGGSDTNWQIYFGGTSVAKVDTGIAKPSTDREGVFTVMVFAPPGGNYLGVRIVNEVSGVAFESSTTTSANIMAQTTAAGPRAYHSVGGTSSVVGLTLFSGYIETDN